MLLHFAMKLGLQLERVASQLVIKMATASKPMVRCLVEINIDIRGISVFTRCYGVFGNDHPSDSSRPAMDEASLHYPHDIYYLKDRSGIRYRLK
jgi:hypothetical protein